MKKITDSSSSFKAIGFANASKAAKRSGRKHSWVTVIDPRNHRLLLQACDDCGVVKSENSVVRNCASAAGQALLSGEMSVARQIAI